MAKAKLGSGARFKSLTSKIEKQGKSPAHAKAIAAAIGRQKFGAEKMSKMASAGRRRHSK